MDNLLRILDRFPEAIQALPSAGTGAAMVHEAGDEYEGKA